MTNSWARHYAPGAAKVETGGVGWPKANATNEGGMYVVAYVLGLPAGVGEDPFQIAPNVENIAKPGNHDIALGGDAPLLEYGVSLGRPVLATALLGVTNRVYMWMPWPDVPRAAHGQPELDAYWTCTDKDLQGSASEVFRRMRQLYARRPLLVTYLDSFTPSGEVGPL